MLAAAHLPGDLRRAYDAARNGSAADRLTRQLRPIESVGFDHPEAFPAMAGIIPASATYGTVIGQPASPTESKPINWGPAFAGYWLLPRRRLGDPSAAQWLVAFGADVRTFGIPVVRVYRVASDVEVAEVAR